MSFKATALLGTLLFASCGSQPEPIPEAVAQELTQSLTKSLMTALQTAMSEEGPAQTIEVCAVQAPKIAQEVSTEQYSIRRIGTRVRNVASNTPTLSEREQLEKLTKDNPNFQGVIDGRAVAMKGIFIPNAMCLTCHGSPEQIPEAVLTQLAARYPKDQAVGYGVGDLRGAFVIERKE